MFEKIINMAYENAMAVLSLKKCDKDISENARKLADAIQGETKAERRRDEVLSNRSKYINVHRESIQTDLGLIQKVQEFAFEKDRARSKSESVVFDEQEVIDLLEGDELGLILRLHVQRLRNTRGQRWR